VCWAVVKCIFIADLNSVLSYTEMKLMKQETCSKLWSKFGEFQLDKDLICTDKKLPCDVMIDIFIFSIKLINLI